MKLHTLFDVQSSIPVLIDITGARTHDTHVLDRITFEPGCFIVMDRGYVDFARLYRLQQSMAFFVLRAKHNVQFRRRVSRPVDRSTGVRSDQIIILKGRKSLKAYPVPLRRVHYFADDIDKHFVFITNNFLVSSQTIASIYKYRWQVELFFKWIKQHLRIKRFLGNSPNAVKTQIWIAISIYALIATIKKRLGLQHSLYTILQILSTTLFEKTPVQLVFQRYDEETAITEVSNQLTLSEI